MHRNRTALQIASKIVSTTSGILSLSLNRHRNRISRDHFSGQRELCHGNLEILEMCNYFYICVYFSTVFHSVYICQASGMSYCQNGNIGLIRRDKDIVRSTQLLYSTDNCIFKDKLNYLVLAEVLL